MWNVRLSFANAMYCFYTNVLIVLDRNNSKVQLPAEREEGRQDYFRDLKPRPHLSVLF